jgi:hypothetical protein
MGGNGKILGKTRDFPKTGYGYLSRGNPGWQLLHWGMTLAKPDCQSAFPK